MPKYAIIVVRSVLIAAAVLMIVFGIFNGGMHDVLQKAIKICTECIGLG
ncbi:MAG: thioredoxin [Clostridia bacterium]|nr:thioredoxin [Oscillospiraceae bacterium]MBR2446455.1 thioredoxin [Clostridia bacterium]